MVTIALFFPSEHTPCAVVVWGFEWVTVALHSVVWITTEVVTALLSCYMAGATWNCCRLGSSSVYTIQPCTSLQGHSHIPRVYVFSCNLSPALLAEWPGSFTCCNTGWWNGYRNKSQYRKLTLEKKIFLPFLPGLEPGTFRSRVRRCATELSPRLDMRCYLDHRKIV